ncbi:MAG: S8 family serine peptidase, partial [Cytophagales bacterium]|nr:S8 family serine peptidase [Cytophagales bacterium]
MKHIDIRRYLAGAVLAAAALLTPSGVDAQQGPQPKLSPAMIRENPYPKLGRDLVRLEREYKDYESQKNARQGPFTPPNRLFQIREGKYVVIDAVADKGALALRNDLGALGAKGITSYGRVVSCLVPLNRITQLQNLRSLRSARPAYAANNVGLVTSGGDSAQRSGLARRLYKVDGKGVKVGALSDSYNQLIGERGSVITGDLPGPENPNGYKKPVQVLEDISRFEQTTSDEGRAMLEIIHDVVPAAELAFHTAIGAGQAGFANGIIALKDSGCNVIVDDVAYLFEPYFQEGIIAQAVNQVAKEGVAYFSSAGNQARDSYEKAFQPSGRGFFGGEAHNFAPGDPFLRFFVPAGGEAIFILQWSDPFFYVSGKGASTDLDLYLVNDSLNRVLFASDFPNLGEDPVEGFVVTNDGPTGAYYNLLIEKASGPDPELIKVIGYDSFAPVEHWTNSGTVVGHSNAAGAIAVGAARYDLTPAFGVDTTRLEPFSSAGGTPILFDENGNKIPAVVRRKPEITGPDGVNTTFFIPRLDLEGDGFPNFFGTSASAPHAAAVAALMLEANKALQPGQVREVLQATALDMDDPYTKNEFDKGFDFGTGYGLIRADRAVESVLGTPLVQRFVLVNADNGEDLGEIQEGDVINLAMLPTRNLNVRAETAPAKVGSVVFDLDGKKTTENLAPYALAGDFATTPVKYRVLTPALSPGDYKLSAVPYAADNGEGAAGFALSVGFRVVESAVTSFVLVDADTGEDLLQI